VGGEIISADSRYLYRGMDIGTAKPTPAEQARVPHHLIDVADPDETWSLALFKRAAREGITGAQARGRLPILVGGTGQYVRAIIEDWDIPAQEPDTRLRARIEQWGSEIGAGALHDRLAVIDPAAAARIQPSNVRRTVRALEVILLTGRRFSEQYTRSGSPYSLLLVGLRRPREELYRRIDERIEAMIASGLIDEVQALLDKGYAPELPTLSAIGYREIAAVLRSEMTLDEAVTRMKRLTRQFVRRQANWFKETDPMIHWFDARAVTVEDIASLIRSPDAWISPERDKTDRITP
ncbi:MAG TPA: tRNA (adenosine(37)-N6)-dimethylallyltransferase MiaA, partial [Anaerolineaceae bacterium]|nr:tRNA (adenosine(37)-N6)-dimethylallyltransferase MiaA [Anaerolineaceae bacterium]